MILQHYKKKFFNSLTKLYPKSEIDSFFLILIEEYLGFQKTDSIVKSDEKIPEEKFKLLENARKRLQQEEPIQYILGKTTFYGFPFLVTNAVLIPRPETEELIEWVISDISKSKTFKTNITSIKNSLNKKLTILDIGTGTGCISISLKKHIPEATIFGIDICKEALKIAKKNKMINEVDVNFILQDILNPFKLNQQLDIIVSNPPYVREIEKKEIKNNVLENEPHLALFVKNTNPLLFYDKIVDFAKVNLNKNGVLYFEINQYLSHETMSLLKSKGLKNIQLKKDFKGNDRMIKASF